MKLTEIARKFQSHGFIDPPAINDLVVYKSRYGAAKTREFLEVFECSSGFVVSHTNGANLSIFGPREAMEYDDEYELSLNFEEAVPVGTDGNSRFVFYWVSDDLAGLWICDMSVMLPEEAVYLSRSLFDLLVNEQGVDQLVL